jgi:hypothetical protein
MFYFRMGRVVNFELRYSPVDFTVAVTLLVLNQPRPKHQIAWLATTFGHTIIPDHTPISNRWSALLKFHR